MARPSGLWPWPQTVSTYVPHLSQPQRTVLVLWSFGIVLAQAGGLTTVAVTLAYGLGCPAMTTREQLRDWYRDAQHKSGAKRGRKRRSLEVTRCFAPLLCWVEGWAVGHPHGAMVACAHGRQSRAGPPGWWQTLRPVAHSAHHACRFQVDTEENML